MWQVNVTGSFHYCTSEWLRGKCSLFKLLTEALVWCKIIAIKDIKGLLIGDILKDRGNPYFLIISHLAVVDSNSSFIWHHYHFSGDEVKVLVTHSCLTLCKPMDSSTLGFPVHHQLLELLQTPVHWVGDVIQSSHPLLSPSPPAFNLSQHQGLFQGVPSSHNMAKVLEFQLQHQSFQGIFRIDFL